MTIETKLFNKACILLLITILFYSCSAEKEIYEKTIYENSIKVKTMSFNEFKNHTKAYDKLLEIKSDVVTNNLAKSNTTESNPLLDFNVDVSKIVHFEYENLESFTFPVIREETNGLIENIVISKNTNNNYYAKLLKYNLSESEKIDLENNSLKNITNPIETEFLGQVYQLNSTEICGYETIQVITSCGSGQHNSSNILTWHLCTEKIKPQLKTLTFAVYCDNTPSGGYIGNGSDGVFGNPFNGAGGPSGGYITPNFPNTITPENLYEGGISTPIKSNSIFDGPGDVTKPRFNCLTQAQLQSIYPNSSESDRELLVKYIKAYADLFDIDTKAELAHFLGQVGAETDGLASINPSENLNYTTVAALKKSWIRFRDFTGNTNYTDPAPYLNNPEGLGNLVYCCKHGNGDVNSGDGYKYRARGLIQLTWKGSYEAYQAYLNSIGLGWFYNNPEDLESPNGLHAALSAMWYFKNRVLNKVTIDSNTSADAVTKHINKRTSKSSKVKRQNFTNLAKQHLVDCPK